MDLTQKQINSNSVPLRKKRIKIELLNSELQVLSSLEGYAVNGSITANANNTIRRSGALTLAVPIDKNATTFLDQVDGITVSYQGKIWLDKKLKIYVGLDDKDEVVWNKLGVFIMDKPTREFDKSQYQISFNVVDQMVLLTGDRQGQLTGLGVEIPQFDNANFSISSPLSTAQLLTSQKRFASTAANFGVKNTMPFNASVELFSEKELLMAIGADDGSSIKYISLTEDGTVKDTGRSISINDAATWAFSSRSSFDVSSVTLYVLSSTRVLYLCDGLGNIVSSYDISADLPAPSGAYFMCAGSQYIYIFQSNVQGLSHYLYIFNTSGGLVSKKYLIPETGAVSGIFYDICKMGDLLVYRAALTGSGGQAMGARILTVDVSDAANPLLVAALPEESSAGLSYRGNYLVSLSPDFPYAKVYNLSNGGSSFQLKPWGAPFLPYSTNTKCWFVSNDTVAFFVGEEKKIYFVRIGGQVLSLGSSVKIALSSAYQNVFVSFTSNELVTNDASLFFLGFYELASFRIFPSKAPIKAKTYDALEKVLSELSIIKKYSIHPITGDFEYLPYDIKVGVSATVWDILKKFNDILSTWQFYFDIDGVFRVEPIPSGVGEIVYPLSSNVYIADQNDYDFNNVKNQVVVYGKQNDAQYYANSVEYDSANESLSLGFESMKIDKITIHRTKFAFEWPYTSASGNISFVKLLSGGTWNTASLSAFSSSSEPALFYLNNVWYCTTESGIYRSTDGTSWTKVLNAAGSYIRKIVYGGGKLVALAQPIIGNALYYSSDNGETWAQCSYTSLNSMEWIDIECNNDGSTPQWRAVSSSKSGVVTHYNIFSSTDGINWTHPSTPDKNFSQIKYSDGRWVGIVGDDSSLSLGIFYSTDGITWTASNVTDVAIASVNCLNGTWFAGEQSYGGLYTSQDAITWYKNAAITNFTPLAFAYGNGAYVVGGSGVFYDYAIYYSNDLTTWTKADMGEALGIDYLNYDNDLFIASGLYVYKSKDGINWTMIGERSAVAGDAINFGGGIVHKIDGTSSAYTISSLSNPAQTALLIGSLTSFEGQQPYVDSSTLDKEEVYVLRISAATNNDGGFVIPYIGAVYELYSRLQPRACLINENVDSPFYINRNLTSPNYYAGTAHYGSTTNNYALWLKGVDSLASLSDGALITFMANRKNLDNPTISVYTSDGSAQIISNASVVGRRRFVYGSSQEFRYSIEEDMWANDYTVHLLRYISASNQFEYLGVSPSVYSLVLSGGEFDNIHSDQLAYERCLWELYQHSNLQDNLTLKTVPDYAIDVNTRIPYDPSKSVAKGINMPSEQQYFLTKQITYPLGFDTTPQQINAIRIYEDEGLLGD